jgi:PPK2 family polyphosphate:nucleotide phosphotransferase
MKIRVDDYRVNEGEPVGLKKRATRITPLYGSKDEYQSLLQEHVERLAALQNVLYASASHALLVIFQGMDCAGKDSAIRHVMSGVNPQGCDVHSFKQPSAEELRHDFLWRSYRALPERGRIGIFNRSYYEEVVVVRVHPDLLVPEGRPARSASQEGFWKDRYHSITGMEKHLHRNGTQLVKIFLHLSKDEQRKRLLARIDDPQKNWKFNAADLAERKLWPAYMKAYEACLAATSTALAPWFVVPADDKPTARLIVSEIIGEALQGMKLAYPEVDAARRAELQSIRRRLEK